MFKPIVLIALFIAVIGNGQVQFDEVASEIGLEASSFGEGALGGGVSFFDFDKDGWDDLTFASQAGDEIKFYKNSNGTFSQIVPSGISNTFETKTVQWVDIDNDGDYDFFATSNTDHNTLYENVGNFTFQDITQEAGLLLDSYITYGASWGDIDNDGFLDLFISSRDAQTNAPPSHLYRNNGDRTFSSIGEDSGLLQENYLSFCAAFFDYNNDGNLDLYVANDKTPVNLLYQNNGSSSFNEVGMDSGTNISIDAMTTTVDDYNSDGYLDIYVTNTFDGNAFLENNGDGTFTNVAATNGTIMESVAWGAVFLDADNDGNKDLYVSGEFDASSEFLPHAFYYNDGSGNFSIPDNVGFEEENARNYGNAIGDINNDGYPEIAVLNFAPSTSYVWNNNTAPENNWIKVKLEGIQSNRMGIGSWIEISVNGQKQYNYTLCGEGYLSQNSAYEFFGIGGNDSIDYIKVNWLSGQVDMIEENIPINTAVTIVEGTNTLGLSETTNNLIQIYPNPTQNSFTISGISQIQKLKVVNVLGQKVKEYTDTSTNTFSIEGLNSGVYVLQITDRFNRIYTSRMVVE